MSRKICMGDILSGLIDPEILAQMSNCSLQLEQAYRKAAQKANEPNKSICKQCAAEWRFHSRQFAYCESQLRSLNSAQQRAAEQNPHRESS